MTIKKDDKKVFERELEDYREQIWGCARCNWCQNQWGWNVKSAEYSEVCPAFHEYRIFPYSGMGKMHIARALLEGDFDYEDAPEVVKFIYTCTTCGACMHVCPVEIEHIPKIVGLRQARVLMESQFPAELGPFFRNIETNSNPWGLGFQKRAEWGDPLGVKHIKDVPGGQGQFGNGLGSHRGRVPGRLHETAARQTTSHEQEEKEKQDAFSVIFI